MKKTLSFAIVLAYACGFAQESKELSRLKNEMKANVTISNSTSNPNFIYFSQSVKLKSTDTKTKASEFLNENFKAFNLRSANDLVFLQETTDNYGLKNVTYRQQYQGVPVYDGLLKFHFNAKEELSSINGNSISITKLNTVPDITAAEAEIIAKDIVSKQDLNKSNTPLQTAKTNLLIFPKNLMQGGIVTPYLAYQIEVTNKKDVREYIFINAHTGELVEQFTGIHPIDRKLYETNTNASNLKWKEGDAFPGTFSNWQQNEVVTSEHVYNFFKNAFGYVSYDAADHTMITVNNDPTISCPNARWNGTYAGYCDGTATDDVIAHEWGHAYTEYTSGLIYQYQSGALNESYSDVWGETIDLINNYMDEGENLSVRTTTACSGSLRWKMGEDATAFGGAIRDMWNPNCNGDPAKVLDAANYYCGTADSGGVHTNSGVTNHLYALLVDGGTYNGYTMTGMGFVKAAHLWWRAQKNYLTATSDFANFADALEASANDLIGVNLEGLSTTGTPAGVTGQSITLADVQNVKNGILAVQLRTSPATQCNYTPLLAQSAPSLCANATNNPLFKEDWENGLGNWTVTNVPTKPSTWEARDWTIKSNLPKSRPGKAIFAIDPINGDCASNLQNGILRLESPTITIPTFTSGKYEMAFNHYVATEATWDGGNIKYSLNGGSWTLLPVTAFTQNGYNSTLDGTSQSDNPLKGQRAFTGTDGGSLGGSWGQSVIDLSKLGVTSGSKIKFRFELGTDGCNGVEGWYLDELYIYNCSTLAVEDAQKQNSISVYPNPTSGFVTIQNKNNSNLKNVEIYNVAGQLVQRFNVSNAKNASLDMSQLTNGTYVLKVISETETNSVKVIKK
ncbi:M4 family metallopeptidase [Epilithonimonas sp.]|uniref:M4 family metallopeptidase n=1 Tax=Epilithonimonas sp. TaxID=2894511 RepID=UPI00289F70CC|nr:M4 family metallopeptidase [Epilithonimonas sp.]